MNKYDHKAIIDLYVYLYFQFYFVKLLSTGSCFLHFIKTYNVDICKNELRFIPLNIVSFESFSFADDKNEYRTTLVLFVNN